MKTNPAFCKKGEINKQTNKSNFLTAWEVRDNDADEATSKVPAEAMSFTPG